METLTEAQKVYFLRHESADYDEWSVTIACSLDCKRLEDLQARIEKLSKVYNRIKRSYVEPPYPQYNIPSPPYKLNWKELGFDLESNCKERRKSETERWNNRKKEHQAEINLWSRGFGEFREDFRLRNIVGKWEQHVSDSILQEDGVTPEEIINFKHKYLVEDPDGKFIIESMNLI